MEFYAVFNTEVLTICALTIQLLLAIVHADDALLLLGAHVLQLTDHLVARNKVACGVQLVMGANFLPAPLRHRVALPLRGFRNVPLVAEGLRKFIMHWSVRG